MEIVHCSSNLNQIVFPRNVSHTTFVLALDFFFLLKVSISVVLVFGIPKHNTLKIHNLFLIYYLCLGASMLCGNEKQLAKSLDLFMSKEIAPNCIPQSH